MTVNIDCQIANETIPEATAIPIAVHIYYLQNRDVTPKMKFSKRDLKWMFGNDLAGMTDKEAKVAAFTIRDIIIGSSFECKTMFDIYVFRAKLELPSPKSRALVVALKRDRELSSRGASRSLSTNQGVWRNRPTFCCRKTLMPP